MKILIDIFELERIVFQALKSRSSEESSSIQEVEVDCYIDPSFRNPKVKLVNMNRLTQAEECLDAFMECNFKQLVATESEKAELWGKALHLTGQYNKNHDRLLKL